MVSLTSILKFGRKFSLCFGNSCCGLRTLTTPSVFQGIGGMIIYGLGLDDEEWKVGEYVDGLLGRTEVKTSYLGLGLLDQEMYGDLDILDSHVEKELGIR